MATQPVSGLRSAPRPVPPPRRCGHRPLSLRRWRSAVAPDRVNPIVRIAARGGACDASPHHKGDPAAPLASRLYRLTGDAGPALCPSGGGLFGTSISARPEPAGLAFSPFLGIRVGVGCGRSGAPHLGSEPVGQCPVPGDAAGLDGALRARALANLCRPQRQKRWLERRAAGSMAVATSRPWPDLILAIRRRPPRNPGGRRVAVLVGRSDFR